MGKIYALYTNDENGKINSKVDELNLLDYFEFENDGQGEKREKLVYLLSKDSVEEFENCIEESVSEGVFGENILLTGIDLKNLPQGTILSSSGVKLQILHDNKGSIEPKEGVFARLLQGGLLQVGDEIYIDSYPPYSMAILTVSDKGSKGLRKDESGDFIEEIFKEKSFEIRSRDIVPDERKEISEKLIQYADDDKVDLVLTTGGTGFSMRDITPEATMDVIDKNVPGIAEAMRAYSAKITDRAMLSRAVSGIRKRTLIINLPGSKKAVKENIESFEEALIHGLDILTGRDKECGGH